MCANCPYSGNATVFSTVIYEPRALENHSSGWLFVDAARPGAWAALRYVLGGSSLAEPPAPDAGWVLAPDVAHSPLLVVAGSEADFGTREAFAARVARAVVRVVDGDDGASVVFVPPSPTGPDRTITFPFSQTDSTGLPLPAVDGEPVDIRPSRLYDGPFLKATVGEPKVTATAAPLGFDFHVVYDFAP